MECPICDGTGKKWEQPIHMGDGGMDSPGRFVFCDFCDGKGEVSDRKGRDLIERSNHAARLEAAVNEVVRQSKQPEKGCAIIVCACLTALGACCFLFFFG